MGKQEGAREDTPLKDADAAGALDNEGPINIYDWQYIGYLAQYFSVGMLLTGLPGTVYGVFQVYLNVPSYIQGAASSLITLPWSVKIFASMLSDGLPIAGLRRRPYMVIGWSVCAVFLIILTFWPMPAPYHCFGTDGRYNLTMPPCNPCASEKGTAFAVLMCLSTAGYVLADAAADGLTVAYARREPLKSRGNIQTTAYMVRQIGQIVASVIIGFGMNGPEYNGTFGGGLSFNTFCGLLALVSMAMVPTSYLLVYEPSLRTCELVDVELRADRPPSSAAGALKKGEGAQEGGGEARRAGRPRGCGVMLGDMYDLCCKGAVFDVILFFFLFGSVQGISTTAGPNIQQIWADVQQLQSQLFGILGGVLFFCALWLVKARFLNASWRAQLIVANLLIVAIDAPFTLCTVFGIVRNQYFYLDDSILATFPQAAAFIVTTYVIVELAPPGAEAITYGLLSSATNVGGPVSTGLSNWIFSAFRPSLSDADNYLDDTSAFRWTVADSVFIGYAATIASFAVLPLLPDQKADTQERLRSRPTSRWFALASLSLLGLGIAYSVTTEMLSLFPSTACLSIAGGGGCGHAGDWHGRSLLSAASGVSAEEELLFLSGGHHLGESGAATCR